MTKTDHIIIAASRVASANQAEAIAALGEESSRYFLADISAASNLGVRKATPVDTIGFFSLH